MASSRGGARQLGPGPATSHPPAPTENPLQPGHCLVVRRKSVGAVLLDLHAQDEVRRRFGLLQETFGDRLTGLIIQPCRRRKTNDPCLRDGWPCREMAPRKVRVRGSGGTPPAVAAAGVVAAAAGVVAAAVDPPLVHPAQVARTTARAALGTCPDRCRMPDHLRSIRSCRPGGTAPASHRPEDEPHRGKGHIFQLLKCPALTES